MSYCYSCNKPYNYCSCGCSPSGCPIQLDFSCILYNKDNNQLSELDGLNLTNGTTLKLFAEAVDEKIKQLNVIDFSLPCLRADYVINTLKQFAESVDTELCIMKGDIEDALAAANTPLTVNDSTTINFSTSGTLQHTLTGSVILSVTGTNLLTALGDGLHVAPQTLSVDYVNRELTISDGNTVDLNALCGCADCVGGYLGNLASDPDSPINGQYWSIVGNASALFIQINGVKKTISLS